MEKTYTVVKTDLGLIATSSHCDFSLIRKCYPEMEIVGFKLTKEEVKSQFKNVKFETFDI